MIPAHGLRTKLRSALAVTLLGTTALSQDDLDPTLHVTGTVQVRGPVDDPPNLDGTLSGRFGTTGLDDVAFRLDVVDGRWSLEVPAHGYVQFLDLHLGGRRASFSEAGLTFDAQRLDEPRLNARFPEPLMLEVVDRDSGRPLSSVTVLAAETPTMAQVTHPGPISRERTLVDATRSPFALEPWVTEDGPQWRPSLWVHAPGHTWRQADVNFRRGGVHRISLPREAGRLVVHVAGAPDDLDQYLTDEGVLRTVRSEARARGRRHQTEAALLQRFQEEASSGPWRPRLRLRREADFSSWLVRVEHDWHFAPEASRPDGDRPSPTELATALAERLADPSALRPLVVDAHMPGPTMTLTGLEPDIYVVSLEVGDPEQHPAILSWSVVEVRDDAESTTRLAWSTPPTLPAPVPLRGTLIVPSEWRGKPNALTMRPLDVPFGHLTHERMVTANLFTATEDPTRFTFDAGPTWPGRLAVEVTPFGWSTLAECTGEDLILRVPPPAVVHVELRDAQTHEAIPDACLRWRSPPPWGQERALRPTSDSAVLGWSDDWDPLYHRTRSSFTVRVPAGALDLHASIDAMVGHHDGQLRRLVVGPGEHHLTFDLQEPPPTGLSIRLLDGVRALPPADYAEGLEVRRLGSHAIDARRFVGNSRLTSPGRLEVEVLHPGRYEILVHDLDGYDPIPAHRCVVSAGQVAECLIPVSRRGGDTPQP